MSDRYTVIFEGRIMPGKSAERVKDRLKSALKTDDQGLARLFTGDPVAVRQHADLATAEKYKKVFAAAGEPKFFHAVERAGHCETIAMEGKRYADRMIEFLDQALADSELNPESLP